MNVSLAFPCRKIVEIAQMGNRGHLKASLWAEGDHCARKDHSQDGCKECEEKSDGIVLSKADGPDGPLLMVRKKIGPTARSAQRTAIPTGASL